MTGCASTAPRGTPAALSDLLQPHASFGCVGTCAAQSCTASPRASPANLSLTVTSPNSNFAAANNRGANINSDEYKSSFGVVPQCVVMHHNSSAISTKKIHTHAAFFLLASSSDKRFQQPTLSQSDTSHQPGCRAGDHAGRCVKKKRHTREAQKETTCAPTAWHNCCP